MKKIIIIIIAAAFGLFAACKKTPLVTVAANIQPAVITSPSSGTSIAVTVADSSQILTINWKNPDYGVSAVVSYFVQIDSAGKNFSKFVTLANLTSANTLSLSYNTFNSLLLTPLNLTANAAASLEMRLGTAIYGKDTVYSKVLPISLTTLQLDQLWLPGSYEGYNPAAAPIIPSVIPKTTYEGFAYFSAAGNFKFTSAPDYNHINYGDGGNGTLTTNGNAGGIGYSPTGVYLLDANVAALTYSTQYIQSFGIIGTATPQGWNASTPMTYNQSTGLWTITIALIPGALKFRANDSWNINYGPTDPNALTGVMVYNNPNAITINNAGNYTVTMDMTQTKQKGYLYTVVQN
jgi:starch-binding outer membrane protein SusE/F